MRDHSAMAGVSFGPEALKVMGQAFDEAWLTIADNFGADPGEIASARWRLAEALLSVAGEGCRDVAALKTRALQAMALTGRTPVG